MSHYDNYGKKNIIDPNKKNTSYWNNDWVNVCRLSKILEVIIETNDLFYLYETFFIYFI